VKPRSGILLTIPMLVFSRVLQGVGGAMIIANGMALATEHHPASQRGLFVGHRRLRGVDSLGNQYSPGRQVWRRQVHTRWAGQPASLNWPATSILPLAFHFPAQK